MTKEERKAAKAAARAVEMLKASEVDDGITEDQKNK